MKDPRPNMVMVTALILALAALLAGPAQAKVVDTDGTTTASSEESTQQPFDGGSRAVQIPTVIPYLSHGMGLGSDTGVSAAQPERTIPYLSHGIGVDRGSYTGLEGKDLPQASATSGDGFGRREGGIAAAGALLVALLASTALVTTRHRSRMALP